MKINSFNDDVKNLADQLSGSDKVKFLDDVKKLFNLPECLQHGDYLYVVDDNLGVDRYTYISHSCFNDQLGLPCIKISLNNIEGGSLFLIVSQNEIGRLLSNGWMLTYNINDINHDHVVRYIGKIVGDGNDSFYDIITTNRVTGAVDNVKCTHLSTYTEDQGFDCGYLSFNRVGYGEEVKVYIPRKTNLRFVAGDIILTTHNLIISICKPKPWYVGLTPDDGIIYLFAEFIKSRTDIVEFSLGIHTLNINDMLDKKFQILSFLNTENLKIYLDNGMIEGNDNIKLIQEWMNLTNKLSVDMGSINSFFG